MHADPLVIDPDRLAPLALFAVEAITNAQKHAFGRARRHADGATSTCAADEAELEIARRRSRRAARRRSARGVGRTLMTAFARQLRGKLLFDVSPAGGLLVRLIFPTPQAPPIEAGATGT